jgi:hypothetical protein
MSEKTSVAEQPGFALSLAAILIALFVGVSVRALTAPEKVREQLIQATANIHRDFKFEFKDAYVSLARGLFPDLSVIIKDVTIQSDKACWLSPNLEINEIRLPLAWIDLFRGKFNVREILADDVSMSMRTEFKACDDIQRETASQSDSTSPTPTAVPAVAEETLNSTSEAFESSPLKTLEIKSFKIHYLPVAFTSFEIRNFKISQKAENPQVIEAGGLLNLGGETIVGDYSSQAEVFLRWEEGRSPKFTATAKGLWREGHYDLNLEFNPQAKHFSLSSDIRHLPLSQVIPVLKKYRWMESEFNGKQAWFSGQLRMAGSTTQLRQTPIELKDLKLEGNLGEILVASINVESLEPLKYPPFDLQIHGLNLQEFLNFLGKPHPSPALGSLGVFNGVSKFSGPNQVTLSGDFSGLEFIFANRGSRQVQTISLLSGELEFKNNRWNVAVDRIRPLQGIFDGKVKIEADRDFKKMQLNLKLEELTLDVQALMTTGGKIGALRGQLMTKVENGEISALQGQLKMDQMLVDGISFHQPRFSLRTSQGEIVANLNVQNIHFMPTNPLLQSAILPLIQGPDEDEEGFMLKNFSTEIHTEKFNTFSWRSLTAQTQQGLLRSSGGWDDKGKLHGDLLLSSRRWQLGGFRSSPLWSRREQ